MRKSLVFVVLLAAGCEQDLLADVHDAGPDGPPDAAHCTAPLTDAHAPAMHTLYINFDGVTLTHCNKANAPGNCSDIVQGDTTFPPFMDGLPARDGYITWIVDAVKQSLAPYSIDIVTTRPAPGTSYYMTVFGGTPALVGADDTVGGISPFTCSAANRNLVSMIFDFGENRTTYDYASSVLSDLAMMAGLPGTTGPNNDCACRSCAYDQYQLCTYGVDSPTIPDEHSCGLTTADEPALLRASLGCR
ncbi:MAG TPA: hypothetical protein VFV99_03045 [Kofleriaceae bacterium]|nr:hypothetical protein [Kofleriaceae bacterium]